MFKRGLVGAFILFPLFVSCGKDDFLNMQGEPKKKETEKVFLNYVKNFENVNGTIKTTIIFGNLESPIVGLCKKWNNSSYREIEIDREYWDNANELSREQLILHELGHCELNLNHKDSFLDNNCPSSVMRSYTFFKSELNNCFEPNFKYYLEELFL